METKLFEIRDRMTMIPVLAVRLGGRTEEERYFLARSGFGRTVEGQKEYVMMIQIVGGDGTAKSDPFEWSANPRTFQMAHSFILRDWDTLKSGDVIDVEFLNGEKPTPKVSERIEHPEYPG